MGQFRMVYYCAVLILTVGGCAPSTATKPNTSSPSSGSQDAGGQRQGEGARGKTVESATKPGSIDVLRQGQRSTTPASSPLKDDVFDFDRCDLKSYVLDTL